MNSAASLGVDFVILWVDGSDPGFRARHAEAIAAERARGIVVHDTSNRHRDNGELLFLLRAIQANMPWYRRIHIVTNGQRPRYVDFTGDRIRLVTHADIFPDGIPTPAFNTFAIESCIHRIEGLSEIFVRFSDDFFVGAPVSRQQFLGPDGFGHALFGESIFNVGPDAYHQMLENNALAFRKDFGFLPMSNHLHAPQLRHVSVMRRMEDHWRDWIALTRGNRFRHPSDLATFVLYPYFALAHHRTEQFQAFLRRGDAVGISNVNRPPHDKANLFAWVQAGSNRDWRQTMRRVVADRPRFFNINDGFGDAPDRGDVTYIGEQLLKMFPKPSPFENAETSLPGFAAVVR